MPPKSESQKRKIRLTLYVESDLVDEARGALVSLGYEGRGPVSLSEMFNDALRREIVRLRRRFNEGEPFTPYRRGLPGGRPRKT